MSDPQIRLEKMLQKLRENRFRVTPQRIAVLKILALSHEHPSIEMIFEHIRKDFPTMSLATVYKTVTVLKSLGEVLELGFPAGGNRYDGNKPYSHPHVICTQCKKIMDPELSDLDLMTTELESKTGFEILNHRMDFFGICPECKDK